MNSLRMYWMYYPDKFAVIIDVTVTYCIAVLLLTVIRGFIKHLPWIEAAAWGALWIYLYALYGFTVFTRLVQPELRYEFSFLWSWRKLIVNRDLDSFVQIFCNMLMLVPLGLLLPANDTRFRRFRRTLLAGFLISCSIEMMQLFLHRGVFEFDDILHNTIGAAAGYGLYFLAHRFRKADLP